MNKINLFRPHFRPFSLAGERLAKKGPASSSLEIRYPPRNLSDIISVPLQLCAMGPSHDRFYPRITGLASDFSREDYELIQKAYQMSKEAFKGKKRLSGVPYVEHLVAVAEIIKYKFKLPDAKLIAAALTHDIIEDTSVTYDELAKRLGKEVADLVDGITKLSKEIAGEKRTLESLKKLFKAMVRDPRIGVVKIADNLHNMKDQWVFPTGEAKDHAIETLDIYARIAEALGMWDAKCELEDMALPWINPELYKDNAAAYAGAEERTAGFISEYATSLRLRLTGAKIPSEVYPERMPVSEAMDKLRGEQSTLADALSTNPLFLARIFVAVPDEREIEKVVDLFKTGKGIPAYSSIENYLLTPRPNGYQGLHIHVPIEGKGMLLVVVLTERMLQRNKRGILYHLERKIGMPHYGFNWRSILDQYIRRAMITSDAAMREAISSFASPITVFTPTRTPINLPHGSTVLDFAFAAKEYLGIHADHAVIEHEGVRRKAGLFDEAPNGATIKIITSRRPKVHPLWLSHVKLPKAMDSIRKHLGELSRKRQAQLGKSAMDEYSKPFHTDWESVKSVKFFDEFIAYFCEKYGLRSVKDADALLLLIGRGDIDPTIVGDEFNQYYSNIVRQRKREGRFRPMFMEISIDRDRPGLLNRLTLELARLKINIDENYGTIGDGKAKICLIFGVLSSLQVVQAQNIVDEFLEDIGGGKIVRVALKSYGEQASLGEYMSLPSNPSS